MKTILTLICAMFLTIGMNAQNSKVDLNVATKALSEKISNELNIEEDKQVYLHRAILQTAINTRNAKKAYANNPQQLENSKIKIQEELEKILVSYFDQNQVTAIKGLISEESE